MVLLIFLLFCFPLYSMTMHELHCKQEFTYSSHTFISTSSKLVKAYPNYLEIYKMISKQCIVFQPLLS